MLSFRTTARLLLSAAVLSTGAAATPAMAADPDALDQWQRWIPNPANPDAPRNAWIRSLDFIGPLLFAGGEGEGVYSSPTPMAGWDTNNSGLKDIPGAKVVHEVKTSPDGQVYAATSAGLFKSAAGMGGWTQVGGGEGTRKLNMGGVQSIKFNGPTGTDITVAVAGAAGAGVYNTIDGGAHWDRASGMANPENVYHLTTGPAQTPIYAAADNGVYASVDFGRSWLLLSDGIPPGETTLRVAVSPTNPKDLYASTSGGVYSSWNGGITWDDASGKDGQHLPAGGKRAFLLTPDLSGKFGPSRAIVGTESGVWGTLDNGEHWKPMSGRTFAPDASTRMADRIVWALNLGFGTPVIMAGTQGFGVFNTPIMPIDGGAPAITPTTGLEAGTELKIANLDETNGNLDNRKYMGFKGTKPYFFTYQWRFCDENGDNCDDIDGAKGTSYVIPKGDANTKKRYYVKVTAKNLVKPTSITAESTLTTGEVAPLPGSAPRPTFDNALQPKLTQPATPVLDSVLTVSKGKWRTEGSATEIDPDVLRYRWERCTGSNTNCTILPNAAGTTYKLAPADIAKYVRVWVSATEAGVGGDWFLVGGTGLVQNKYPVVTSAPAIVGDAWVGSKLNSTAGGWSGYDMTYERVWYRCESAGNGKDGLGCNPMAFPTQTGSTYVVRAADKGKYLKLQVKAIGKDDSFNRVTTTYSSITPVITDPPPPPLDPGQGGGQQQGGQQQQGGGGSGSGQQQNPQPPKQLVEIKLPKKLKVGATLSVPKTVSGFKKLKFQWLRNGKKIKKATKRTYKVAKADRGKLISCQVTLTPKGGGKAKVFKTLSVAIPKK